MFRALFRIAIALATVFALGACAQLGGTGASAGAGFAAGSSQDFDVASNSARNSRAIYQGYWD